MSPQNLDKDKRAGTLSNQVSWHFVAREACSTLARTAKGIYRTSEIPQSKARHLGWGGGMELIQQSNIRTEQCG